MPLDPLAARILQVLSIQRQAGMAEASTIEASTTRASVVERRKAFAGLMRFGGKPAAPVSVEDRVLEREGRALPLRLYAPAERPEGRRPGLVFLHGGGFVAGGLDTHDAFCRALAVAARCCIIAVDYRLAPEHPYPAAIEDACAAWAWVQASADDLGLDSTRLGIAGDSAGASLAILVCAQARAAGAAMPALQLLLCPITDFAAATGSRRDFAQGYLVDQTMIEADLSHYLPPGIDPGDPRISPLRLATLAGLPPALIHTAEYDPFRDEGAAFVGRLQSVGVSVTFTCNAGLPHLFYAMSAAIPAARAALIRIGEQIQLMFGS